MEDFKILTKHEIKKLSEEERIIYQRQAKEYYGNLKGQLQNFERKGLLHYPVLALLSLYPVHIIRLNDMPEINGSTIYTANHSNSYDFPTLFRIIKKHFFIMADYTMINDPFVDFLNRLNGCVYIDRESKESGINAFNEAVEGINKGYNMLVFCEGTWNLLDKEPMLPRKWGDIKIAQATERPIEPIALAYNNGRCFVKFGEPRYVGKNDDIKEVDAQLFDEMCKLRQDIWNSKIYNKLYKEESYEDWLRKTIKSYKYFDVGYEMSTIRKKDDYRKEDFEYISQIGEEIRPLREIEKRLALSKVNYRLK